MKNFFLLFLFSITKTLYGQVSERNYHFDSYKTMTIKNHYSGNKFKVIKFQNSKDSTSCLQINYANKYGDYKSAYLGDRTKKESIKFGINFYFKKIEDLLKLEKPIIIKHNIYYNEKVTQFNPNIEKIEYENDTIKNSIIVHLTRFDDDKFKKIINEEYYFFEKDNKLTCNDDYSIKNYLQNSHNLKIDKDLHLKKIYRLHRGKIAFETEFQEIINIDYNFKVKI